MPGELRRGQAHSFHALRQGASALLREYRSRLFGKTGYRFERYP